MAFYVKANPKVAEFLNLANDRWKLSDGNYLLWQNDMLVFGRLSEIADIARRIGAVVLMPHEAKLETDGALCKELPTAEDERFYIEPAVSEENPTEEPIVEGPADEPAEPCRDVPDTEPMEEGGDV